MELQINWIWLLYSTLSTFSYGTETFLCTIVTDQIHFLVFGKFAGGFLLGIALLLTYKKQFILKNNFNAFKWIIAVSVVMLLSLVFTLLGLIHAVKSGANPGLLISLQLISTLVAYILGKLVFKEKSSLMQYIGSMVLVLSIGALLISRSFHDRYYSYSKEVDHTKEYWIAAAWMLIGGIFFGWSTWIMKYALVNYLLPEYEFTIFQLIMSGMVGMLLGILLKPEGNFINFNRVWYNMLMLLLIGVLAAGGTLFMFLAAGKGTIQLTQVIVSSYPVVQILLEAVFLFKFLSIIEIGIVILILFGSSLIVLCDTEETSFGVDKVKLNRDTERSDVYGRFS